MSDQRPSIARIYEAWLILTLAIEMIVTVAANELDAAAGIAGLFILALGLSVTRWRSALARWLISFLAILAILMLVGDGLPTPRSAWELFLDYSFAVDLALLWSAPMSRWLRSRPTPEPAGEMLRGGGTVILLAFAIFALMSTLGIWPI